MKPIIQVKNLTKKFKFPVRSADQGIIKNFFCPKKKELLAVDKVSFELRKGEAVALIGPNGAGKSTTIKMLTGILYPTEGKISVAGFNPQKQRKQLSYHIGTVFGQRSQLVFNLPVRDSFQLFGKIYELSNRQIKERSKYLIELLGIEEIADQPVRKLSLGQRMRAEIAVSLIHKPRIIFLDEPTIGLDVVAKRNLRESLRRLNQEEKVTLLLTSHDAGDIEALCPRTIIVNHGKIILDQKTEDLKRKFFTHKKINLEFKNKPGKLVIPNAKIINHKGKLAELSVNTKESELNEVLQDILARYEVEDVDVENISLEEIIASIYEK